MATYYVHIPNSKLPTAEVDASSTKHARTSYLDFLSRNSLITWHQRQSTRKLVHASQMQPGDIQTQVKLDYEVSDLPTQEVEVAEPPPTSGVYGSVPIQYEPEPGRYPEPSTGQMEMEEEEGYKQSLPGLTTGKIAMTDPQSGQSSPQRNFFGNSPIIRLSKKSRGM